MKRSTTEKRRVFRTLHESGCFVMPNPWDVGSALALQSLGFPALATTSAGMAWSLGRPDNGVDLETVLAHLRLIADAVDVPVNADFENAFADSPEGVAAHVAQAVDTGVAGLSVEDGTGDPRSPLYDFDLAVARIAAARSAIDAIDPTVVLTARSEGFVVGLPDLAETVRRLSAFAAAGADCLYAPGIRDPEVIGAVVRAVAPLPVNVLTPGLSVASLAALGTRRVSVGGALARTAWGAFLRSAREIASEGAFTDFSRGESFGNINALFERSPDTNG
jgi:2-methylisocitrate lyase-like PEP mutase family enzyme